jgi:hypothetical protein
VAAQKKLRGIIMGTKDINDDMGQVISNEKTDESATILLSEEGPDVDIKKSTVVWNKSGEAETIVRYGSNKADDQD